MRRRTSQRLVLRLWAVAVCCCLVAGCADAPSPTRVAGERIAAGLRTIPQQNYSLGAPAAPAVMTVYADPFCFECARLGDQLEHVIARDVGVGRLRLQLRPVTTPGYPAHGLREAFAASLQNRLWNYTLLFWEAASYEVDPHAIAAGVPGLDVRRLDADRADPRIAAAIQRAADRAKRRRARPPALFLDPPGSGSSDVVEVPWRSGDLADRIDRILDERGPAPGAKTG